MRKILYSIIAIYFLFQGAYAVTWKNRNHDEVIICEDGEKFFLAQEVLKNLPQEHVLKDYIIIEIKKARLSLYRDNKVDKVFPIAVGKSSTPTPVGEWKIIHKGGNWGGGFGDRWMGLNVPWGIFGIHGTNKPGSIGNMASHGCIRMFNRDIRKLYSLVKVGMPVYIRGDLPRATWHRRIGYNMIGKDVLLLQFALKEAGLEPGPADGRFGRKTDEAVSKLQWLYGFVLTGIADHNEWQLLGLK